MLSFKLAAIKILREAQEPLHYEEITKRAVENNLIVTSGATPEATMNAQLAVDINTKKDKSAFIRTKPGYFALNSNFTEEKQEEEEKNEVAREEVEQDNVGSQYVGKAGEHLVVSELLFRGYNASIMNVDVGLDIVATKGERLFNIQVKTSNVNHYDSYIFDIRITSFERHNGSNTFYIFVLKGKEDTKFLILPYFEVQKNIDQKNILDASRLRCFHVNMSCGHDYGNRSTCLLYTSRGRGDEG